MWPELYINSKLVSLAPSVRHHHRHLHYHRYYRHYYERGARGERHQHQQPGTISTRRVEPTPGAPAIPFLPVPLPTSALQPGGRRKLLEFSKSDVQDIMNEGMASSRRWRRWWSSNRGCLQRAGGAGDGREGGRAGGGRSARRWAKGGAAVVRRYPGKTTRLGSLFCLQSHPPAHSSSLNYIPT